MNSRISLAALLLGLLSTAAQAGDCCTRDRCTGSGCGQVCQLVCTTRTVKTTCYGYQCETICIPGPSQKCKKHCEPVGKCDLLCCQRWTAWIPGCAKPHQRKTLRKYVVTREVPSYQWVVKSGCACSASAITKPAPLRSTVGDAFPLSQDELRAVSATKATAKPRGR